MRPVVGKYAEGLYDGVLPIARTDDDESQGWALLRYCGLLAQPHELIEQLVTDSDEGPGWSALLDLDRTPFIDWLGQFVGVTTTQGYNDDQKRIEVREAKGFRRGTRASILAAARLSLTGAKHASLIERDGGAYRFTLITFTAETPDPDQVVADVLAVKPAGLIFTHVVATGWNIDEFEAAYAGLTIDDFEADFASIEDFERRIPI